MQRLPLLLLTLSVVSLIGCSDSATDPEGRLEPEASFGVEPSPFAPVNVLGTVESKLVEIDGRIDFVFSEDGPSDDDGVIDQLDAMAHQLVKQDEQVQKAMSMDAPTMPEADFLDALSAVRGEAFNVFEKALSKMGVEPSPFHDGLGRISEGATAIVLTIASYEGPVCSDNPCDPAPGCCIPGVCSVGCQGG